MTLRITAEIGRAQGLRIDAGAIRDAIESRLETLCVTVPAKGVSYPCTVWLSDVSVKIESPTEKPLMTAEDAAAAITRQFGRSLGAF